MIKHLLTLLLIGASACSYATNHLISISGFSFTPATVNASVGDTVTWNVPSPHTATEVSQSTWNANGSTPLSGGFDFTSANTSNGTSFIVCSSAGTRWYVCQLHAGMGMKGQINVATSSVQEVAGAATLSAYPNPVSNILHLNISNAQHVSDATVEVINIIGKVVMKTSVIALQSGDGLSMDVSILPKGVYFVKLSGNNELRPIRFVKL